MKYLSARRLCNEASVAGDAFTFTGRLRSMRYAVQGIPTVLAGQHNAWVHAAATAAVVIAGVVLHVITPE